MQTGYRLLIHVTVPCNSTAEIHIPASGRENFTIEESGIVLWQDGRPVTEVEGLSCLGERQGHVVFEAGSGEYYFTVFPLSATVT